MKKIIKDSLIDSMMILGAYLLELAGIAIIIIVIIKLLKL